MWQFALRTRWWPTLRWVNARYRSTPAPVIMTFVRIQFESFFLSIDISATFILKIESWSPSACGWFDRNGSWFRQCGRKSANLGRLSRSSVLQGDYSRRSWAKMDRLRFYTMTRKRKGVSTSPLVVWLFQGKNGENAQKNRTNKLDSAFERGWKGGFIAPSNWGNGYVLEICGRDGKTLIDGQSSRMYLWENVNVLICYIFYCLCIFPIFYLLTSLSSTL